LTYDRKFASNAARWLIGHSLREEKMPETLLSPSTVLLYGREVRDLTFTHNAPSTLQPGPLSDLPPPRLGGNNFLQQQLAAPGARLARIYGFSFEGHYCDLAKPAIFLVHGEGTPAEKMPDITQVQRRVARGPADADRTGVAGQAGSFSEDIRVWSYDKGDFSVRLDVETGTWEDVLLAIELGGGTGLFSGAQARISGAQARISGAQARISGAQARIRNRDSSWGD
jgi:hypothetical protein